MTAKRPGYFAGPRIPSPPDARAIRASRNKTRRRNFVTPPIPVWKARLQVNLCERILAEMDNPDDPHALLLYQCALSVLRQAEKDRRKKRVPRPRPRCSPSVESPYLDIEAATVYTRLGKGTLYNAVYSGKLKKQPGTRKVLFTVADLDAYLTTKAKHRR